MGKKRGRGNYHGRPKPSVRFNVVRYTFDAWMKCYPNSNINEWEQVTNPSDVELFVEDAYDLYNIADDAIVMPVTLDEEYWQWLEKNDLENSDVHRSMYAEQIDPKNALRLFLKEEDNKPIGVYGVCVTWINEQGFPSEFDSRLSDDVRNGLINYLGQIYGKENVYIGKHLVRPDYFIEHSENIFFMARKYFDKGVDMESAIFDKFPVSKGVTVVRGYVPVCIRFIPDSVEFSIYQFSDEQYIAKTNPHLVIFNQDGFRDFGLNIKQNLDELPIWNNLLKTPISPKYHQDVYAGLCHVEEVAEFEDDFFATLKEVAEAQGGIVRCVRDDDLNDNE